jgi:hypothetical protein
MFLLTAVHIQKQIETHEADLASTQKQLARLTVGNADGRHSSRADYETHHIDWLHKQIADLELHLACTLNEETYPPVDDLTAEPTKDELAATRYLLQFVGGEGARDVRYSVNQIIEAIEYRQRARKAHDIADALRFTLKIEDLTGKLAKLISQPLTIGDVKSSNKYRLHQHITIIQTDPNIRPVDLEAELDRRQFYFLRRVAVQQEVARLADMAAQQAARRVQFNKEARQTVAA